MRTGTGRLSQASGARPWRGPAFWGANARSLGRRLAGMLPVLCAGLLSACSGDYRVFHPVGPVASAEFHYTLINTGVMMLIILPTTVATCVFAWRYRKSRNAAYDPAFSHSMSLEMAMWGLPLIIVVILAFCAYSSVFAVNPADPKSMDAAQTPGAAPPALQVDVITTDWQWIFVYPQLGIATIDDLVVPAGEDVRLDLTSATVTNDFYIPQVAPMIDVMPGMRTQDAFRVDQPGTYEGFSADFSGAGFSWMQFSTRILPAGDFAGWVKRTQGSAAHLDFARFQKIAQPTINEGAAASYFTADPGLFRAVYDAVRNGEVFPVPEDIDTKTPARGPAPDRQPGVNVKS